MITRRRERTGRVGVFGVGHATYWPQFEGLLERLMAHHATFLDAVRANGVDVVDFGMVDSSPKAYAAADAMAAANLDVVFCNMLTYATSSTFAPIIRAATAPLVLIALQPMRALDYSQAKTAMQLENDSICSVPEFTGVAIRMGRPVDDVVIGTLTGDEDARAHVAQWCEIAKVLHDLKGARIGLMGHVLEAMYDMHADPTAISAAFGCHVPLLEVDDLLRCYETVDDGEVAAKKQTILDEFDMPDPKSDPVTRRLTPEDLEQAARTAVALDRLVDDYDLTGMAYYYEGRQGSEHRTVATTLIVGNSLLTGAGIPICGEADIKTCVAMLIMDRLDIGGSFAEFHPFDFNEDFILVGHDGPAHIRIADGKPVLRSLIKYHGKPGSGASVEFKLKEGPITMLGISSTGEGRIKFVIGEGESRKGPIPPTGNTNTRGFFAPNTKDFVRAWVMEGPTHHYALGIGHHAAELKKIGDVLGVEAVIVKP
ncbi:MAG: L-fucose/L-arabinose isomerase family protein [Candidatus Hydrogenedentes bacterium]|nr:L-fucose/L-arabinose isomerase family protein [Candidatus Hydrogenedentota bacterium]